MHVTKPVPFSIEQLEALTSWSEKRPWGLSVTISTEHERMDEVAELWREDRRAPHYSLVRHASGLIEVASIYTLPEWTYDLRAALAVVEALERAAACATE